MYRLNGVRRQSNPTSFIATRGILRQHPLGSISWKVACSEGSQVRVQSRQPMQQQGPQPVPVLQSLQAPHFPDATGPCRVGFLKCFPELVLPKGAFGLVTLQLHQNYFPLLCESQYSIFQHFDFTLDERGSFGVVSKLVNKFLNVCSQLLLSFIFSLLIFHLFILCPYKVFIVAPFEENKATQKMSQ